MQRLDLGLCLLALGSLSLPLAALLSWPAVAAVAIVEGAGAILALRG